MIDPHTSQHSSGLHPLTLSDQLLLGDLQTLLHMPGLAPGPGVDVCQCVVVRYVDMYMTGLFYTITMFNMFTLLNIMSVNDIKTVIILLVFRHHTAGYVWLAMALLTNCGGMQTMVQGN